MADFLGGGGVDVATLGLRVDAREVEDATRSLDNLQRKGTEVERTTGRITTTTRGMSRGMATTATALENVAIRAGGLNARLVRTISLFSSFTMGATRTIGVLAGLAAIAAAFRQIGKDAREARLSAEQLFQESFDRLGALLDPQLLGADVGRIRQRLYAAEAELAQIPVTPFGQAGRDRRRLEEEIRQLRLRESAAVLALQQGEPAGQRGATAFDALLARAPGDLRQYVAGFTGAPGPLESLYGPPDAGRPFDVFASEGFRKLSEEQQLLVQEMIAREEELSLIRRRANDELIRSLENVGRAYGGVIDQIIALTAATLRLFDQGRLPGFREGETPTTGDYARGLGTAALTGIGFGVSSGSAAFGGIGGGVAGFASAGPAGAIVGAVSGIVSGLFEQGRRAREAARIWEANFTAFDRLFDDPGTPLEQRLRLIDDQFNALLQSLVDNFSGANARDFESSLQRLLEAREENIRQAHEMADAEDRLFDSRFRALNAPTGLNLQYLGWEAIQGTGRGGRPGSGLPGKYKDTIDFGAIGVPDGGVTIEGDIHITVDGSGDARQTASDLFREIRRQAKRGGPSAYLPAGR